MTETARILGLTTPAVSQQIKVLELEYGTELVQRRGRGIELTLAGRILNEYAARILDIRAQAFSELAALKGATFGTVRVTSITSVAAALLPRTISLMKARYPHLSVVVDTESAAEGLEGLRHYRQDVALMHDFSSKLDLGNKMVSEFLIEDEIYVAVPSGHRLADNRCVELVELADEDWIVAKTSPLFHGAVLDMCQQRGFEPNIAASSDNTSFVFSLVEAGCGISVVPGLAAHSIPKGIRKLKLEPAIKRRVFTTYRMSDQSNPLIRAFLDTLKEVSSGVI